MTYPCGIIRDLLPLYIDSACNADSKQAVERHLSECEACRNCYDAMKSTECFPDLEIHRTEDAKMASSLKNVKNRINKKIGGIVCFAAAAMLFCIGGYHLLFNTAVKNVSLDDVSFSANVYSLEELVTEQAGQTFESDSVTVSISEQDDSKAFEVKIPELGEITLTENTIEKCQYATVISISSEYFLKTIKSETKDHTIYITAIKTTVLGNKAADYQKRMNTLELQEINSIIFVEEDGTETLLWCR